MSVSYEFDRRDVTLLVIDPQRAFGSAVEVPDAEAALEQMRKVISLWRPRGMHLILTKHVYSSPDEVGRLADFIPPIFETLQDGAKLAEFHEGIYQPGDRVVSKTRFNACLGTDLIKQLRDHRAKTVVICGLTTPICVQTTADALMMADFQAVVLEDACASQPMGALTALEAHRAAIERMRYGFAQVMTVEDLILHFSLAPR